MFANVSLWSQLDGCVVLCVDNEPAILDGMRSLLENWHCKVLQASDAAQAFAVMSEAGAAPDLILVDYHLAAETGIDCIGAIRAKAGYDVPAILITADRSPGVEERGAREWSAAPAQAAQAGGSAGAHDQAAYKARRR